MKDFVFVVAFLSLGMVNSQQKPTYLSVNQRFPNDDENKVCSRIRDVIPRNSGRFRKILIRNTNNDALYVNDDCRYMTARTKSKLDILASRVRGQWPGLALKVLESWTDRVDPNNPTSLHYEGRSVALQVSDGNTGRLGRLGGLALEAGFDWVHYTRYGYIRASVIPDVCQTSVDLVFLLDGSGSVQLHNFQKVKEFVKKVVDFFNIGRKGTHIGVVQYSTKTETEFNLIRYFTKSEMKRAVDGIPFQSGWTYTAEALKFLKREIFTTSAGMRTDPGIPKVLVLITDGKSQGDSVGPPAQALKNIGISIFSIGVGSGISISQLNQIASDPDKDYVFQRTFDNIADWVDRLSAVSCSEGSLIDSCKDSVTSVESGSFKYFRTQFQFVTKNQVSVELRDITGISHLYASRTTKNPGPLDPQSQKNEENTSPKAVSVAVDSKKTVFVAVQGQQNTNKFTLSFWDNLFLRTSNTLKVNENQGPTPISQLDLATNRYSLKYKITDGNREDAFTIDSDTPILRTKKPLDREHIASYSLVIVAENVANKCHKSRTKVVVVVEDENDNKPKFTKDNYQANVLENAQINTIVKTVLATDADVGVNGQITYTITSQSPENKFRINQQGQVILTGALNYESITTYTLNLEARDGGGEKDTSKLVVNVQNVNEPPKIRCNNKNCKYSVDENVPTGTSFAAAVIGTDPDIRTPCSPLQYILPSSVSSSFKVDASGVILTNGALDREQKPSYSFYVTVRDCGGLTDSVHVIIDINDKNDNAPKFRGPYKVDILESEQIGSNVVQVSAQDADEGINAEITYTMTGSDSSAFHIDSSTGRITTRSKLDFETKPLYKFQVKASDGGKNAKSSTEDVTVKIVDVNDNAPKFVESYSENVREDARPGEDVLTVKANDSDSDANGQIHYSIVGGNFGNAFAVDESSGLIKVYSKLDRETRDSYALTVQASDGGSPPLSARTTVSITIVDVNDNSPIFQGPYRKSVLENFPKNKLILKVTATDKDSGSFGQVSYSITSPPIAQETFSIDNTGNIKLRKSLDYEKKRDYTFTVTARDGGGRETPEPVKIFVGDVNDNDPIFEKDRYNENVAENVKVGHVVGGVKATDADSGPRGRISYYIIDGNVGNAFRINAAGTLSVASSLDRETRDKYELTVQARDDGSSPRSSVVKFIVTITDVNDNNPRFTNNSYSFKIYENNAEDTKVGDLGRAVDLDIGKNAEIVYSIVSGDDKTFEFKDTGELYARKALNREDIASYSLEIEARDKGTPSLYTKVPVEVTVLDRNDNDPKFTKSPYDCSIDENSASVTRVCFVRATDEDIGDNGKVVYELVSSSDQFSVSKDGGEIRTKVSLDRETKSSYTLTIKAKDLGKPSRSANVQVNVNVVDKNDNEPSFNGKYSFKVKEDASVRENVGKVTASDPDDGNNGRVKYTIVRGNIQTAFAIDKDSGDITVASKLDREKLANYRLTIEASDHGSPGLSSRQEVPIKILDVNDNAPIFTSRLYSGQIAEDAAVGSRVVQVLATDLDEGVNSQIKYSITEGEQKEDFTINEDSGLITTAKNLDYEKKKVYTLTVKATDQGDPSQSGESSVRINVKNTNDNAPTFVPGSPIVHVSEAVAIGTKVVKFNATDKDGNKLTFSITKGNTNDDLAIHSDSGLLTTKNKLDRETVAQYNLTVTVTEVTNTRAKEKSSSQNLTVIVTDENDNGPEFKPKAYTKDIDENSASGVLLTVHATDADEGKNAEITFSLDRAAETKFSIDSNSGVISTKTPLDREKIAKYDIVVTAKDSGTPSLSSKAKVTVTVNDLNDNKPRFSKDYTTNLRENTAKGGTVLRVEASDPDSGANGKIFYSIISGNNFNHFEIDNVTGIISVKKSPDRETNAVFILHLRANNQPAFAPSTPTAKTECSVRINITDANDNAPNITNTVTTVSVVENSPANTEVLDVDATDADIGDNGKIEYEIVGGNVKDAFQIDHETGVITTKGKIDRETLDEYTLTVQASDKGRPSSYSTKDFVVKVTDLDDNPPVFKPSTYLVSVPESANLSTVVVQLKATDEDINNNAKITFSVVSGNDEDHFRIESDSGVIYTNAGLDFEKITEYNLVVDAKDTKHTRSANVTITVQNINDNFPEFNPSSYQVNIPENHALDTGILTVKATDKDPFGGVTYSLDPLNVMFTVDPASGVISPVSELDRETTDYYRLTVRATDGGSPSLSSTAVVRVNITDINDNSPMFNSSGKDIEVVENSPIDKVVMKVTATDADLGVNAELRYKIEGGNEQRKFTLDEVSGYLKVYENIDREKDAKFRLEIVAQDKGDPSLKSSKFTISIKVLDENDNDPQFTKEKYVQNVTENLSNGTFVMEVKASDKDIDLNGRVTYDILSGDEGYFTIDKETGIVKTTKPLDRELIPLFQMTIEARDQGNPSRNSTASLQVNVLDANDNSPRLDTVVANVTEERPKGEFVTRIVATDPDLGKNGEIEYSLTSRGEQSLKINRDTGEVTTRVTFDYEQKRNHTFKIIATDKGNSPLSTTADLIINVLDIDDNCPEFNPKEYNVTIEENVPYWTDIVRVYATDIDTVGENLNYGIRSGNFEGTFIMDPSAGIVKAGPIVDRENVAEYNLIVRAGNDFCGVNRTGVDIDESIDEAELSKSIAKVNIFLTDLNDNAPKFLQDSYEYELKDIYTSSLLWLNATDPDEGINSEFDFGLERVIRIGSYRTLNVSATDKGNVSMMSTTTLNVTGIKCEAMDFSVSTRGHVSVKTLCDFNKIVVPKDAFVGEKAIFNCSAQGNTIPEYRWFRNSVPVTDWLKNGGYVIQKLTKNDDGVYSCQSSSEAGSILSTPRTFSVKEPARVVVHPEDTWVEVNKKATLRCRAAGDTPISYKWYKDNKPIAIQEGIIADKSDLVIERAVPEDTQSYYCKVSNYPDAKPSISKPARIEVYVADAVVDMELTVNKPHNKEKCQYFNITNIEETIETLTEGKMTVVAFVKPRELCNLTSCSSDPCFNNGQCQTNGSDFICQCPRGWTGKQCQIDVDECKLGPCYNGTCVNRRGSFSCDCPRSTFGRLCQFTEATCKKPNQCSAPEKCYPKESQLGYECLSDVRVVDMVFKLNEVRRPFNDWMVYDIAREIKNAIDDGATEQTQNGRRRRRDVTVVDYSDCSVRVTEHNALEAELRLKIIFVCASPPKQKYVCDTMLNQDMVSSCKDENGWREQKKPTTPPPMSPKRVSLAFIVRLANGEDVEASDTVSILLEGKIEQKLNKHNMYDVALRARSVKTAGSDGSDSSFSSGAIVGVVVGVIILLVLVILAILLASRSRQRRGKGFSIGGRAILTRSPSSDAILSRDIKMRELENTEVREVNNRTFSEIYEDNHGNPRDLEDGGFMVENPQQALRKNNQVYLEELESSPWFHGSITRAKAEDLLDATDSEGTFLVRAGLDMGEFYISVRTPNTDPKFRHIPVNRRGDSFVAVCSEDANPQTFTTFKELVEYLRANPVHIEGLNENVVLKDHISKV